MKPCACGCGREFDAQPIILTHSFDGRPFAKPLHLSMKITLRPSVEPAYVGDGYPRIAHLFRPAAPPAHYEPDPSEPEQ